jgi:hypothetical protein
MTSSQQWKRLRTLVLTVGLMFGWALYCHGQPDGCWSPHCLEDLDNLSACQLNDLFTRADVGHPLVGCARGKLIYLVDKTLTRAKLQGAAAVWRGKCACEDGSFVNRWVGGRNAIGSQYVIGPSWVDGKPAVIIEYPPGTKLFWNMHDELREIAPGLYLGPVYERFPCPKFRGYLALQLECGCEHGRKR